jgi:hypothetical protein
MEKTCIEWGHFWSNRKKKTSKWDKLPTFLTIEETLSFCLQVCLPSPLRKRCHLKATITKAEYLSEPRLHSCSLRTVPKWQHYSWLCLKCS